MQRMMNKIKSKSGETIAEVLVACLIAAMGLLLLAVMVTTSQRLIEKSENLYKENIKQSNQIELGTTPDSNAGFQVEIKGSRVDQTIDVQVYRNTENGPIYRYEKK